MPDKPELGRKFVLTLLNWLRFPAPTQPTPAIPMIKTLMVIYYASKTFET